MFWLEKKLCIIFGCSEVALFTLIKVVFADGAGSHAV